jgi:hypothetical protein
VPRKSPASLRGSIPGLSRISLYKRALIESPFASLANPQDCEGLDPVRSHEIKKKVFILGK